ncbi:cytochrome c oxidase subunit 3 [Thalassomonas actiniarum]|uniref:Cytochrome c oxidase subunit 3 n=1 Tax=Thalassomonas actiniarum TaxID=485447 RepID=A0AAE9YPI8_9GAMM|nr:cytochrome c oxidase subunit 3 [Thalassomonas actiniarum]WDD98472.1 cytochrome c oxidase subunit 3 [Thalassomonas actiniarum]
MSIFSKLAEKPWLSAEESGLAVDGVPAYAPSGFPAKTALKFFIAVVSVLFFLFTITYLSRSQYPDFQALAGEPWLPLTHSVQLWLNSGFLLLASIFLQLSSKDANKAVRPTGEAREINALLIYLVLAVIFSIAFVFGQYLVWQQLSRQGFLIYSNPANSYFYMLTAVHGIHLLGGLLALVRVLVHFYRKSELALLRRSLGLCAFYWHYLFLLWLFLFALLTASPDTYNTIAAFCGF